MFVDQWKDRRMTSIMIIPSPVFAEVNREVLLS